MKSFFQNKKILIGLILVLVVLIGLLMLFFLLKKNATYTVSFDTDGGTEVSSIKASENEKVALPTEVSKEGYIFNGWITPSGVRTSLEYVVTENIILKAIWIDENAEKIVIKFDTQGGTKIDDILIAKGDVLNLPENPRKDGYIFKMWIDKNDTPIYDSVLFEEDTLLYAVWEKEQVRVEENKPEPTKKEYYCSDGYTLNDTKCTKTETIDAIKEEKCPNGTVENDDYCIDKNDTASRINVCKAIEGYDTGVYVSAAGGCFYGEMGVAGIDSYTCLNIYKGKYHNGHCYKTLVQGGDAYTVSCPDGYVIYNPVNNNSICVKKIDKDVTYKCQDGYTLNDTKCTKIEIIDASIR